MILGQGSSRMPFAERKPHECVAARITRLNMTMCNET
jgi:hypothetical protein